MKDREIVERVNREVSVLVINLVTIPEARDRLLTEFAGVVNKLCSEREGNDQYTNKLNDVD